MRAQNYLNDESAVGTAFAMRAISQTWTGAAPSWLRMMWNTMPGWTRRRNEYLRLCVIFAAIREDLLPATFSVHNDPGEPDITWREDGEGLHCVYTMATIDKDVLETVESFDAIRKNYNPLATTWVVSGKVHPAFAWSDRVKDIFSDTFEGWWEDAKKIKRAKAKGVVAGELSRVVFRG